MIFIRDLRVLTVVATWFGNTFLREEDIRKQCLELGKEQKFTYSTTLKEFLLVYYCHNCPTQRNRRWSCKNSGSWSCCILQPIEMRRVNWRQAIHLNSDHQKYIERKAYQSRGVGNSSGCDFSVHTKKRRNIRFRGFPLWSRFHCLSTWSLFGLLLIECFWGWGRCKESTKSLIVGR